MSSTMTIATTKTTRKGYCCGETIAASLRALLGHPSRDTMVDSLRASIQSAGTSLVGIVGRFVDFDR